MRTIFALTRFEIRKLLASRRSLAAFGVVGVMNLLFALAFLLRRRHAATRPVRGLEDRLVGEFLHALSYTQIILAPCMFMLFPVVLAVIGGHILAGEIELGSLRMTACRPVARWQILAAKFATLCGYSGGLLALLLACSYAVSVCLFPAGGDVLVFGPMFMLERGVHVHAADSAVPRLLLSYALALPMLLSVSALSIMLSLTTRHFTASAILTATIYFCSYIVSGIPFLSSIHPFLPTRYLPFFRYALLDPIPWGTVATDAGWTLLFTVVLLCVSAALFSRTEL